MHPNTLNRTYLVVITLIVLLNYQTLRAQESITGIVVAISDGDTFTLLKTDKTKIKVRVANIDCPERKQDFSTKAKQFTADAIFNKIVKLEVIKKDRYGRYVANVYYGKNLSLSQELLKAGLAWHYKEYSKDANLQVMEDKARANKVGLWQDIHAIAPWDYRASKKKKTKS